MQHQIGNLRGSTNGRPPLDAGAVVNGPNGKDVFDSGGLGSYEGGMVKYPLSRHDSFAEFNGHGSRCVDDVRWWETDEPALDMTAEAIAAAGANRMPDRASAD
jgi:endoglucanase